jgi:Ca2+/Na+ antiporter
MDLDERLRDAWQASVPDSSTLATIVERVHAHRRWQRWQRAIEVCLTLLAVLVFAVALVRDDTPPMIWLLLPFYALYLPVVWLVILRAPSARAVDPAERVSAHARLRIAQIRVRLRDLWLARRVAWALMAYAVIMLAVALSNGPGPWRDGATALVACALLWLSATYWISRRPRRQARHEYRRMRRLLEPAPDDVRGAR